MRMILFLVALLIAGSAIAATITPQIGGGINQFDGGISSQGAASGPALQGSLMLEDGTSFLLLEDGSSHVCFEGGC